MHINNWVHASDLMKMVKSANSISTLSSEEGLPDNHVITIRERELTVDFPELIQNNIKTDTVTLDLDAEWDGIQPVIIFGPNADGTIAVEYTGEPVHIPGAVMQYVGGLDCSVMGLDDSGEVRLVTKAAPNTFEVVESGEYIGQISEDDVSLLGQILSAIKDVETATSDASSAAEDATAAANSANTAATKATNAANSANTAATKATNAANSANTASERAENAYDVLTPIIAEIGVNGNQPRATTNPNYIATASDAYAAKPLEIRIKGETWVNRWPVINNTINGITVSTDETGLVTITGTATANTYIGGNVISIAKNANITLVRSVATTGIVINVQTYNDSVFVTNVVNLSGSSGKTQATGNTGNSDFTRLYCSFKIDQGTTVNASFRVMLVEGTEAPDCFTPCASITSVQTGNLVTAGKNLVIVENIGTGSEAYNMLVSTSLPEGSYTISGVLRSGTNFNIKDGEMNGELIKGYVASLPVTISVKSGQSIFINAYSTGDVDYSKNIISDLQLELGSTATAYVPSTVTETALPEVELRSLPNGICDELVIRADGTCEVERKLEQKTIDAEHPATVVGLFPASGTDLPYVTVHGWFASFDAPDPSINSYVFSTSWPYTPGIKSRGIYRTWNAIIFVDERFTDKETAQSIINETGGTFVAQVPSSTEPQSPVTLPTLPSPNITVYHDSDVPSDITVEYVQDINIVLDNLNAKIAALNIAQSISS